MKPASKIRKSFGGRLFDFGNALFVLSVTVLCVAPFLFVISASVSPFDDILKRKFFLYPKHIDFTTFRYIFSSSTLFRSIFVSLYITGIGTLLSLAATVLTSYPLSKPRLQGRSVLQFLIVFTMLFSGGMIPTYLVVSSLGLIDSLWSLWLPGLITPYFVILLRNFFQQISPELEEAAIIDGADDFKILLRVYLPLAVPAIATFALFYAVAYWNSYFNAILYINNQGKWPIQIWLRQIVILAQGGFSDATSVSDIATYMPPQNLTYAVIVVATLPILVIYPFIQKYFTKGMMIGSVKG